MFFFSGLFILVFVFFVLRKKKEIWLVGCLFGWLKWCFEEDIDCERNIILFPRCP